MGGHILLSFFFYNILLYYVYIKYKRGFYYIDKKDLIIYTFLLIAFGIYGGGEGDYWRYKEAVESATDLYYVIGAGNMEIQYNYLAYIVGCNYNLWRLVLYSIQFVGLAWFLYKSGLNTYPVLLCFISVCLVPSIYGRAFWGCIYYFMGLYLLIEKRNPLFILVVVLCYFSHTQNIAILALLPLAFIKIKKWHFVLLAVFLGSLASLLSESFNNVFGFGGIEGADYLNSRMDTYSNSTLGNFGNSIGEKCKFCMTYLPIGAFVFDWIMIIFKNRRCYLDLSASCRGVLNITIGIVFLALIILMANLGGGTFFYRVLAMILFPVSILIPFMMSCDLISKSRFNKFILLLTISTEFGYLLDMYYSYASGNFSF